MKDATDDPPTASLPARHYRDTLGVARDLADLLRRVELMSEPPRASDPTANDQMAAEAVRNTVRLLADALDELWNNVARLALLACGPGEAVLADPPARPRPGAGDPAATDPPAVGELAARVGADGRVRLELGMRVADTSSGAPPVQGRLAGVFGPTLMVQTDDEAYVMVDRADIAIVPSADPPDADAPLPPYHERAVTIAALLDRVLNDGIGLYEDGRDRLPDAVLAGVPADDLVAALRRANALAWESARRIRGTGPTASPALRGETVEPTAPDGRGLVRSLLDLTRDVVALRAEIEAVFHTNGTDVDGAAAHDAARDRAARPTRPVPRRPGDPPTPYFDRAFAIAVGLDRAASDASDLYERDAVEMPERLHDGVSESQFVRSIEAVAKAAWAEARRIRNAEIDVAAACVRPVDNPAQAPGTKPTGAGAVG